MENKSPDTEQSESLARIDGKYIIREIQGVLYFEKGILFTVRGLLTNPGENVRNFLLKDRTRLVKPIIFIIVTSLIYSLTINLFHIEEQYVDFKGESAKLATSMKIFSWIRGHYGYANIIMGVFIAFWTKLFFKKHQFNLFEILILLCFVMGIAMLIFSIFAMLQGLTKLKISQVGGIVGVIYCSWAVGHFFGKDKIINYVKALLAYILGMVTFTSGAILVGILIDLVIKH